MFSSYVLIVNGSSGSKEPIFVNVASIAANFGGDTGVTLRGRFWCSEALRFRRY